MGSVVCVEKLCENKFSVFQGCMGRFTVMNLCVINLRVHTMNLFQYFVVKRHVCIKVCVSVCNFCVQVNCLWLYVKGLGIR